MRLHQGLIPDFCSVAIHGPSTVAMTVAQDHAEQEGASETELDTVRGITPKILRGTGALCQACSMLRHIWSDLCHPFNVFIALEFLTLGGDWKIAKTADREVLSRLVDASDRTAEDSLSMGDPEVHLIEEQLFDAIVDSGDRAAIKNRDIYLADPSGLPEEIILVDLAGPDDVHDPRVHNLDKDRAGLIRF